MDTLTIREIVDQVLRGQIRVPAFQRGFVWEPDRVAYLMDSIYKRYPFGSLLFWRTKERLKVERDLSLSLSSSTPRDKTVREHHPNQNAPPMARISQNAGPVSKRKPSKL
jgi:uncharacterized protein with ParB-like and HNH nuclease domain